MLTYTYCSMCTTPTTTGQKQYWKCYSQFSATWTDVHQRDYSTQGHQTRGSVVRQLSHGLKSSKDMLWLNIWKVQSSKRCFNKLQQIFCCSHGKMVGQNCKLKWNVWAGKKHKDAQKKSNNELDMGATNNQEQEGRCSWSLGTAKTLKSWLDVWFRLPAW